MRVKQIAGIGLAVLVMACGRTVSNLSAAPSPNTLPGFARSYDQVFSAAVDAATELKWSIAVAQKDAGLITATPPIALTTGGQRVTIRVVRGTDSLVHVGLSQLNTSDQQRFYERLATLLKPE